MWYCFPSIYKKSLPSNRTLQEVPAIYALIFVTPRPLFEVMLGIGIRTFKHNTIGQLFPKMVEDENLNVIFNFDVVSIKRRCFDKLEVESFLFKRCTSI